MRTKKTDGFTIIEVALVLAIAGLIFLMVFIALPALQRLQRDTARREDMATLIAAVKKYQSNNRGSLPTNWTDFQNDYLGDSFVDPSGTRYGLTVNNCGSKVVAGGDCTDGTIAGAANAKFPNNYKFIIALQATCDGPKAVGSSNPRKIAVLYVLEGSGTACMNS